MANVRKRILELTALESASLNTTIVGVDGGITYKIELDTLADAVTSRVNILDRDRLASLESVTSSFEIKGRSVISSSAQITTLGFISSSTSIPAGTISSSAQITLFGFVSSSIDITSLNSFTSSQSSLNTAFTNGITARLQTSSFNEYTSSQSTSSLVDRLNTIESVSGSWITESETGSFLTSLSGAISSSSQLTSSYDTRYTLSGSVPNIPTGSFATTGSNTFIGEQIISSSLIVTNEIKGIGNIFLQPDVNDARYFQIYNTAAPSGNDIHFKGNTDFNYFGDDTNYLKIDDSAQTITITGVNGVFVSSSLNVTDSINGTINATNGVISGSSQLTSSFDTRYTLSGSVQPLPSNLLSSSAQITAFGFISSSTTIDTGSLVTTSSFTTLSSSVDSRLDTLEASIITGSVNYVQKLGSRVTGVTSTGATIISENITTTGNPVQIMVTGDANPVNVASWARLQIFRNETAIGNIVQVENSSNLNVPYCLNVIDTASAGTYTYSMRTVSGISGLFDFGESTGPTLTAVELNSKTSFPSGTISGSSQLTSSFDTRYTLSGSVSAVPSGTISGSSQLTSSYDARYTLSSSFSSISSSFNSRFNGLVTTGSNTFSGSQIFSGSMVVTSGQIIASAITNNSSSLFLQSGSNLYVQNNGLVEITGSLNATSITGSIAATNGVISGSTQLTTAFPSKTTGAWSVPAGASTQSFTVEAGASYTMWVNGNIPNGIITWNATVTTSNTNVPVVGSQYGWYYTAGNALVLTAMPDQIIGTTNTLISSPTSYAPNTSNVFKFGITNNSGTTQTINYGYIKLS